MKQSIAILLTLAFGLMSLTAVAETPRSIEVKVNGLVCAFCAQGITSAFSKEEAAQDVFVSLEDQFVAIELRPEMDMEDEYVRQMLIDAGYDVVAIERTNRSMAMIQEGVTPQAETMDHHAHKPHHD